MQKKNSNIIEFRANSIKPGDYGMDEAKSLFGDQMCIARKNTKGDLLINDVEDRQNFFVENLSNAEEMSVAIFSYSIDKEIECWIKEQSGEDEEFYSINGYAANQKGDLKFIKYMIKEHNIHKYSLLVEKRPGKWVVAM